MRLRQPDSIDSIESRASKGLPLAPLLARLNGLFSWLRETRESLQRDMRVAYARRAQRKYEMEMQAYTEQMKQAEHQRQSSADLKTSDEKQKPKTPVPKKPRKPHVLKFLE